MKDVTFRFWRPDEKMPEGSCRVVVIPQSARYLTTVEYSKRHNLFNCHDGLKPEEAQANGWTPDSIELWATAEPIYRI